MALLLERNGPPPLAMFDEIIECVPDGIFLYDWSYTIRDRATIAGVANKFEILQTYMERLAEARTLERIELTSWKTVSKKVEFELTATVARWYVPRPPDKVEPTEEADKPEESKKLLDDLLSFACQSPRTYEHQWHPGDLVVWDNRCVLHRARPYDHHQEARVMRHTRISGDPASEMAA